MKLVFLDANTLGDDISFTPFEQFGEVIRYGFTQPEELRARADGADILITNKVPINEETLGHSPTVRMIAITATGTNIVDLQYADSHHITVTNVKGYSTESVVQHTFSLLFYLFEQSHYYDQYVKSGAYTENTLFTHFERKFYELSGKTWGIVGLGEIGRRVADVAKVFGCHVIYYSTSGRNQNAAYEQVDFDTLLSRSDIISIHAPLIPATQGLFDQAVFGKMKASAYLINVGRGPIVDEQALFDALIQKQIAGAGLDVLSQEPMSKSNPLLAFTDSSRLIITPHIAWATVEARHRLMDEVALNIRSYIHGESRNHVPYLPA
jgi:glycerate dehydrogenase